MRVVEGIQEAVAWKLPVYVILLLDGVATGVSVFMVISSISRFGKNCKVWPELMDVLAMSISVTRVPWKTCTLVVLHSKSVVRYFLLRAGGMVKSQARPDRASSRCSR